MFTELVAPFFAHRARSLSAPFGFKSLLLSAQKNERTPYRYPFVFGGEGGISGAFAPVSRFTMVVCRRCRLSTPLFTEPPVRFFVRWTRSLSVPPGFKSLLLSTQKNERTPYRYPFVFGGEGGIYDASHLFRGSQWSSVVAAACQTPLFTEPPVRFFVHWTRSLSVPFGFKSLLLS